MGKTTKITPGKSLKVASAGKSVSFKYKDLQKQCHEKGLSCKGDVQQLKDRLLAHMLENQGAAATHEASQEDEDTKMPAKKSKTGEAIAKEFICPITLQLPFDPVTAEDGRVYERNAIQTHIDSNMPLKSPITNQPMGKKLFPHPQTRNIIEAAIQNGDIPEDLAKGWKDKMQQHLDLEEKRQGGQAGNGKDAVYVATIYHFGNDLVMKDLTESAKWWKLAADDGETLGLFMKGLSLFMKCRFVLAPHRRSVSAISMLTEAAVSGSSLACLYIGQVYADGVFVIRNPVLAARFIRKGLDIESEDSRFVVSADGRKYYQALLQQLGTNNPRAAKYLFTCHEPATDSNVTEIRRRLYARPDSLDLLPYLPPDENAEEHSQHAFSRGDDANPTDVPSARRAASGQQARIGNGASRQQDGADSPSVSRPSTRIVPGSRFRSWQDDFRNLPPFRFPSRSRNSTRGSELDAISEFWSSSSPRRNSTSAGRSSNSTSGGRSNDEVPPPRRRSSANNNNNNSGGRSTASGNATERSASIGSRQSNSSGNVLDLCSSDSGGDTDDMIANARRN